jgi:hypothetical protein
MKCLLLLAQLLSVCSVSGCCTPWEQPQPTRPGVTKGWQPYKNGTLKVLGEFVLSEGQSTESDSLGVEILKISPLVECLGRFEESPKKRVTLRLYRPADKTTLCEATIGEVSGLLPCKNGHELPSVSVNGINTRERWVSFGLAQTVDE